MRALLNRVPLRDVLATLSEHGQPMSQSVRFCAQVYEDPVFEIAKEMAQQLQKVNSVLTVRERMRRLSGIPFEIDRRSSLSRDEFLDQYYAQNTPVILTDVCDRWPARELWSASYLIEKLGGVEVEVMNNCDADPNYEINADQHKFLMPFDEYAAKIDSTDRSNDLHLVADNRLLANPAAAVLWNDFELDLRYLAPDPGHEQAYLWFGPAATVTTLQHDTVNVLFNQVLGRKHFILIPALAIHRIYNHVGVYSRVDPVRPDLEKYPLFADAPQLHFDLEPGESVFVPAGWWHHVEALDQSISVSVTSFAFENQTEWLHPELSQE
jgi:hypothetical protein